MENRQNTSGAPLHRGDEEIIPRSSRFSGCIGWEDKSATSTLIFEAAVRASTRCATEQLSAKRPGTASRRLAAYS
jgi:hypothetical protein